MLNNEKISIMTKLALYEQKNAKSEIKYSKYYRSDDCLCTDVGFMAYV